MTATDRARFFAGEYAPHRTGPRLRYTCHYSGRVSVIKTTYPLKPWLVTSHGQVIARRRTHDEAIHEAQRIAGIRAVRAIQDGAQ